MTAWVCSSVLCIVSLHGSRSFDGLLVMNGGVLNITGGTTQCVLLAHC